MLFSSKEFVNIGAKVHEHFAWSNNFPTRPGGTFKILGGQSSISVNSYPIFKFFFSLKSVDRANYWGGKLPPCPPPVPPALPTRSFIDIRGAHTYWDMGKCRGKYFSLFPWRSSRERFWIFIAFGERFLDANCNRLDF